MLFLVRCDEADACYIVQASTNKEAKDKILRVIYQYVERSDQQPPDNLNLASYQRLKELATEKKCSPHVLLKAEKLSLSPNDVYSLCD